MIRLSEAFDAILIQVVVITVNRLYQWLIKTDIETIKLRNQDRSSSLLNINVCAEPYNAAGDGKTNDQAVIQRAIDVASASGGGTVTLPKGRTFLCGEIQIHGSQTQSATSRPIRSIELEAENNAGKASAGKGIY